MGKFQFRQFSVDDHGCGMKICSDSVLFGAWFFAAYRQATRILDVGTGSGVLALIAAQEAPAAKITGVEIDPEAARAAAANFAASPFSERLRCKCCDFSHFAPDGKFSLIASNPPFFTNGIASADSARAVARHQSGLTYEALAKFARTNLAEEGHLGLVAPEEFTDEIIFAGELAGLKTRRICHVVSSPKRPPLRVLLDFALCDGPTETNTLHIRFPDGSYTPEYKQMVEPYYTKIN